MMKPSKHGFRLRTALPLMLLPSYTAAAISSPFPLPTSNSTNPSPYPSPALIPDIVPNPDPRFSYTVIPSLTPLHSTLEAYILATQTLSYLSKLDFMAPEPRREFSFRSVSITITTTSPSKNGTEAGDDGAGVEAGAIPRYLLVWTLAQAVGFFHGLDARQGLVEYGFVPEYDGVARGEVKFRQMRVATVGNMAGKGMTENGTIKSTTATAAADINITAPNNTIATANSSSEEVGEPHITTTILPLPAPPARPLLLSYRDVLYLLSAVYSVIASEPQSEIAVSRRFQPDGCPLTLYVAIADPRRIVEPPFFTIAEVGVAMDRALEEGVVRGLWCQVRVLVELVGDGEGEGEGVELGGVLIVRERVVGGGGVVGTD